MLGARTKQVNSYGRRGSRIVNVSDRHDRESAGSSTSDVELLQPPPRPLKRENAIIISPARSRPAHCRLQASTRSSRCSPIAQRATRDGTAKRTQSKLDPSIHVRQPLTPLRPNGTSQNEQLRPASKGKSRACISKPTQASLKRHAPVIAIDIIVLDQDGTKLKQERRISLSEPQANRARTANRKGKKTSRVLPPSSPPIAVSDDSDLEAVKPQPPTKRSNRRSRPIVVSSDESDAHDSSGRNQPLVPLAKSRSRSKPLCVEVVVPVAPSQMSKVVTTPPSTHPPAPTKIQPTFPFRPYIATIPPLLAPSVPFSKPRQLTPIRGNSGRSLFCGPPPPSTPTEADLSLDLAQLDLSDTTEIDDLVSASPEYLIPLLNECMQTSPYEFSAFIESFPFDPIVQSSAEDVDMKFHKIGEASYSEVFGIGDVVLKIIPIRCEEDSTQQNRDEIPAASDAKDVLKEIIVTKEVGKICNKFVKLLKTYVVRGRYPSLLLDLWDEYYERKGSESIRPDSFGLTQIYTIIILPNGGPDLESFVFKNALKSGWHQACSIFWQVARALEQAERLANFEHRDLHWGQILVKPIPVKKLTGKCHVSRVAMDDTRFGIKVTIIDLGLSRMSVTNAKGSSVYWTPFDDEIFEGEGDYQYDIYRMMKNLTGGAWKSFHPFTNVMWLHYLITKLLHEKRLKPPGGRRPAGENTRMISTGYDEWECYDCLAEMERLLGDCIAFARKGQKARRKTVAPSNGLRSAKDVIAYGMGRGWIR